MDDAAQGAQACSAAWIDDARQIVSFHEIPDSRLLNDRDEGFWESVVRLIERGYRVQ